MTIAVFNSGGAQARSIAAQIEGAGFQVRRLSRSAGPERVAVGTDDAGSIARALEGTTAAVFTVPQDYRDGAREGYAERVARAAERAGIERLVVNMGGPVFEHHDDPVTHELRQIRSILTSGAVPAVVLQPTTFLDNLSEPWSVAAVVQDGVVVYPAPEDVRISYISHRSLGDFVVAALGAPEAGGRTFDIGGPEAVTGGAVAAAVGSAAGREVRYVEMPLADFAAVLDQTYGAPAGARIAALYLHYQERPEAGVRNPTGWAVLGVEPESVDAWAARQRWRLPEPGQAKA